eukprot:12559359-Prorocentrum_lima.AAC.1
MVGTEIKTRQRMFGSHCRKCANKATKGRVKLHPYPVDQTGESWLGSRTESFLSSGLNGFS